MEAVVKALSAARALIFDFDGTLVDSNPIKRSAFEAVFSEFPESKQEILDYCWSNNHTPRWEKFRYVYDRILRRPYTPKIEAQLHERFEAATTEQIIQAPEIPGAEQFLEAVAPGHWMGLLSSTPQELLGLIVKRRGWSGHFAAVQGAPVNKADYLKKLIAQRQWGRDDLLFFGDQPEDERSALAAQCLFVGVGPHVSSGRLWIKDYTFFKS